VSNYQVLKHDCVEGLVNVTDYTRPLRSNLLIKYDAVLQHVSIKHGVRGGNGREAGRTAASCVKVAELYLVERLDFN
jgi:hypothetical protein